MLTMKNYLNKALLYKEWKNVRALSGLFLGQMLLYTILPFVNTVQSLQKEVSQGTFNNSYVHHFEQVFLKGDASQVVLIGTLILLGTFIVGIDIMGRKYDSLSSMPFKREEIIISKWIVAALTVIVPVILSSIVITFIYIGNKSVLAGYMNGSMIFQRALINSLTYLFVVTFIMLIQGLSGKNILGGVVGTIFLLLPMGLFVLTSAFLRTLTLNPNILSEKRYFAITDKFESIAMNISLAGYSCAINNLSIYQKAFVLAVVIPILVILLVYSFKNIPLERNGYIVIFAPLEIIFKIGVSVCFALLGGSIASEFFKGHYHLYQYGIDNLEIYVPIANKIITLTMLTTLLCGCIVYVITRKIIEMSKR
jgi:hypothetical protein